MMRKLGDYMDGDRERLQDRTADSFLAIGIERMEPVHFVVLGRCISRRRPIGGRPMNAIGYCFSRARIVLMIRSDGVWRRKWR